MGKLTTHVLDIAHGKPGKSVAISLFRVVGGARQLVTQAQTNADGRCDQPLMEGAAMQTGVYELDFGVGAYFLAQGVAQTQPPFLDVVTLRFGVADATQNYHVPLVASPWSYSTYRGS